MQKYLTFDTKRQNNCLYFFFTHFIVLLALLVHPLNSANLSLLSEVMLNLPCICMLQIASRSIMIILRMFVTQA